jgi:hypothetical protein
MTFGVTLPFELDVIVDDTQVIAVVLALVDNRRGV